MCLVRVSHCDKVAYERVQSDAELPSLLEEWEQATAHMEVRERYRHSTWAAFVRACELRNWRDSHDDAAEQEFWDRKERRATEARKTRRIRRPSPRSVPKSVADSIALERDRRAADVLAQLATPKPPLCIRNRSPERCVLIADAWQGREMLEQANAKSSARAVRDWLIGNGRVPADVPTGFTTRVNEALNLADELWPDFTPFPHDIKEMGHGMHPDAVWIVSDDEDVDEDEGRSRKGPEAGNF